MQKSFDVTGPVELDIRLAAGDIEIDPTLDGRAEVELIAHDEESQDLVANARVELEDRGGRPHLLIDIPKRRGGSFSLGSLFNRSGISCSIRCPHESGVSLRSKSAELTARGTIGALNVTTASGDVEVDRVTGGVNVKSASADVSAREIGDGASIHSASGDIDIEIARGPLNLNSVSGDISIGEAYDNVNANTVSGDQDHGAVLRGKLNIVAVSGDITVGVRRGSRAYLDCSTVSGDTSSDLAVGAAEPEGDGPLVEIRAKTVSGDIRITRAPAPMDTQEVHA
jgi:Putative adhesin